MELDLNVVFRSRALGEDEGEIRPSGWSSITGDWWLYERELPVETHFPPPDPLHCLRTESEQSKQAL